MLNFFLTILIALIGGYIADKKKVPAGFCTDPKKLDKLI